LWLRLFRLDARQLVPVLILTGSEQADRMAAVVMKAKLLILRMDSPSSET
jgi:hypothetical protein